ncbi:MAG: hypothetical protein A2Y10_06410 [Planctomycetes bacterium GWF2_41_51]|nr:MAG: hypothetical protein A2Y10_06410 [Planctomycetes bacterium GWF2_41_51]HBG26411.1 hypothetical protein [Phycisphaerales bacterium]
MKSYMKNYLQLPFILCVGFLLITAGFIAGFKSRQGLTLIKKPLPLKNSFDDLDEGLIAPYKVLNKSKIDNQDVLESLGTEDYLQWMLEDTSVDEMSPVKHCSFFVTYYTGNPDQVPHVPEACYTGGGNQVENSSIVNIEIGDINIPQIPKEISATALTFTRKSSEIWQASSEFVVMYFFKVNGVYKGNRTGVRVALGDLTSEHSYFSKVELKFFNARGLNPDKKQSAEAAEKLLKVLLPVLEKNHWPDWK